MVKNLQVNSSTKYNISKKTVHDVANQLKNDFKFDVSSVIINFISCDKIIGINKKYLRHNFSTDIITFNYNGSNSVLEGEIYISFDDAMENAKKFHVSVQDEIIRLVIHGFLHLLGFDDKDRKDKIKMKRWENKLCKVYTSKFRIN